MADDPGIRKNICAFASAHGFSGASPKDLTLLASGGSDRRFYRLRASGKSCIAIVSPPPGDEHSNWLEINRFLNASSIRVPTVYARDDALHMILAEDAGDKSMYHALNAAPDRATVIDLYKRAVEFLAAMQVQATPRLKSCSCLCTRRFDYAAFRYETDYFVRSFLQGYCGITEPPGLDNEFHRLAESLSAEPVVFMHRDFQSQNIHLLNDRLIAIDFQAATAGPPQYDLVSLLKDAYFVLQPGERTMLLDYYFKACAGLGMSVENTADFTSTFHLCGLQRNMQALAAFAFLGKHKGKTLFFSHIPTALIYMQEALSATNIFPYLKETLAQASKQKHMQCRPMTETF